MRDVMYPYRESPKMQLEFNENLENAKKLIDEAMDNFADANYEISKQIRKEHEINENIDKENEKEAVLLWESLTDDQKISIVKSGLPILVRMFSKINVFSSGVTKQGEIFFDFRFNNRQVYYERKCTASEIQDILKLS